MKIVFILIFMFTLSFASFEEEGKYLDVMKKYRRQIKQESSSTISSSTVSPSTEGAKTEAPNKIEKKGTFKKRNEKWKKKDINKNDEEFISKAQYSFLCTDLEELGAGAEKYKDFWNCEQITKFKISEKNSFNCKEQNLIIEFSALTPSSDSNIKGGVYKTIEAFMEPDGVPLLENEQTILKNCEHLKR